MIPGMAVTGKGQLARVCDLCGGVDDHPRHVIAGTMSDRFPAPSAEIIQAVIANAPAGHTDRLLDALVDTSSSDRHMDCCREAGCPTGECDLYTRGAETKRGRALRTHLESLTGDDIIRLAYEVLDENAAPSIVKGE
jgi:hypothetical protein